MNFIQIFMQGGVLMWLLVLITLVLFGIVIRASWHLFVRGGTHSTVIQSCLDGLLFWGGFAVVIGILGTVTGYHKAMSALVAYGLASPRAVWIGAAEGLVSSIGGLLVLAGAGTSWYVLHWQFLRGRLPSR